MQKEKIKIALDKISEKKIKLYEDYSSGLLDELTYKRLLKKINEDELNLEKSKIRLNSQNSEQLLKSAETVLELCKELKSLWNLMPNEKRLEVVKRLCSNPALKGRSIEYNLKKPFKILAEMKKNKDIESWCPPSDAGRTSYDGGNNDKSRPKAKNMEGMTIWTEKYDFSSRDWLLSLKAQ